MRQLGLRRNERERKWKEFKRFLHNSERGTFCNRTPWNWVIYLAYILLFNGLLAGSFFAFLIISTNVIKQHSFSPYLNKVSVFLKPVPGLSFSPNVVSYDTPLIWYYIDSEGKPLVNAFSSETGKVSIDIYIDEIEKTLQPYKIAKNETQNYSNCTEKKETGKPCFFTTNDLGPCGIYGYGYKENKPCIYLKLNKFVGWQPTGYEGKFPSEIPERVVNNMKNYKGQSQLIWIDCDGLDDYSNDHQGHISYYPQHGFPFDFFPYEAESNYLPPIVAIQLHSLESGYAVAIACSAYARNIPKEIRMEQRAVFVIYIAENQI